MTATVQPVGHITTEPGSSGEDPPQLGGHRYWSSVSETKVEEFACIGIYSVCAYFIVADALRPAINEQPAPSKPVIPKLTTC